MVGRAPTGPPSRSPRFAHLQLPQPLVEMGQNDHANALVIRKSKSMMTAAKKAHTVKHLVLGGLQTRKVHSLSPTYEGKRHDTKIVDEAPPPLPQQIFLYKDTGLQGYAPERIVTCPPQKNPQGQDLTPGQKEQHTLIASLRMVIDHSMNGIKRCRLVQEGCRNTQEMYDDLTMESACGLHNFRVECRYTKTVNPYSR